MWAWIGNQRTSGGVWVSCRESRVCYDWFHVEQFEILEWPWKLPSIFRLWSAWHRYIWCSTWWNHQVYCMVFCTIISRFFRLHHSNVVIGRSTLKNPICVIANYLFDTLCHDIFQASAYIISLFTNHYAWKHRLKLVNLKKGWYLSGRAIYSKQIHWTLK